MVVSSRQMSYLNQVGQTVNTNILRYNSFVQLVPRVFLLVILQINVKDPLSLKLECRKLQGLHGCTFLRGSKFTRHLLVDRTILKQMQTLTEIKPKA